MRIPKAIEKLIESFQRLPGIGPKTAQRLAFYLLFVPQSELEEFGNNLAFLKKQVVLCKNCFNIGESELCEICQDPQRDNSTICVVEDPLDVVAIEKSGRYKGVYHVLHGVIDPLNNLGPDDIYIPQLIDRINRQLANNQEPVKEVIIATNPTMEGEATAAYIIRELRTKNPPAGGRGQELRTKNGKLIITRIGRGLPTGADLEYADEITIQQALEGRVEY